MLLLIDAYNLMHQSDVMQRERADGWLARARERLVNSLAAKLGPDIAKETCLVFDARTAPRGLPSSVISRSIEMRFAVDYEEADDLLEEIIARHPSPKRLMVVSSDHRVQRAASRRGALFLDADLWYERLQESGPRLAIPSPAKRTGSSEYDAVDGASEKPGLPASASETEEWLLQFELDSGEPAFLNVEDAKDGDAAEVPFAEYEKDKIVDEPASKIAADQSEKRSTCDDALVDDHEKPDPSRVLDRDLANPFPEGYGEDLLDS